MMSYNTIIYSVPGTGTRFCKNFLEYALGYKQIQFADLTTDASSVYSLIHSSKTNLIELMSIMSMNPAMKIVIPLRDPYLSYITRYCRVSSSIIESTIQDHKKDCIENWHGLIEISTRYQPIFLPIDCNENDRLRHLVDIGKYLGANTPNRIVEFTNEWTVVGSQGITTAKSEYVEQGTIYGEKPTFLDFAVEWYEINRKSKP